MPDDPLLEELQPATSMDTAKTFTTTTLLIDHLVRNRIAPVSHEPACGVGCMEPFLIIAEAFA